jgi:hypothetical protein
MKFDHIGIPTTGRFDGEIELPHLQMTVSDHQNNPFGIQWQRYWDDAPYPELVKTIPHVAFEVEDLTAALQGQRVIIEPNSPSHGVRVAFVEVNGAPVELLQIDHEARPRPGPTASLVDAAGPTMPGRDAPPHDLVRRCRIDRARRGALRPPPVRRTRG